ncbi:MAG: hypothetical protein R3F30_13820 [Planctomycetota bacterium]
MELSIQSLIFWTYTILAFSTAQYAMALGLSNRAHLAHRHFGLIAATSILMLPAFLAATLGSITGWGPLLALHPLLPILCLTATWANLKSLRRASAGIWLLIVPITVWNVLLAVLYGMRLLVVLGNVDLGHNAQSLLTAFAFLQRNLGSRDAELLPVFLYLPLVVPPFIEASGLRLTINGIAGFLSASLATLFLALLPGAFSWNLTLRKPGSNLEVETRGDLALSMRLPLDGKGLESPMPKAFDLLGNVRGLSARLVRAEELGLTALELPVSADLVNDAKGLAELKEQARLVREAGLELIVSVQRSSKWRARHRIHPKAFQKAMMDAQWILAEHLKPDALVLYSRPFGPRMRALIGDVEVAEWKRMIEESLTVLRRAHPDLRTIVDLELPTDEAQALYEALNSDGNSLDGFRFVIASDLVHATPAVRSLLKLGGWLASVPPQKQVGVVVETPAPLGFAGAVAQELQLRRVFAYATRHGMVQTVGFGRMFDDRQGLNGYWDARARPRLALLALREMLARSRGQAAPGK